MTTLQPTWQTDDGHKAIESLQRFLNELAGCECSLKANRKAAKHINSERKKFGLDLFLDEQLTQQVSVQIIEVGSAYPNGRIDLKASQRPQKKIYRKVWPQLYLGIPIHVAAVAMGKRRAATITSLHQQKAAKALADSMTDEQRRARARKAAAARWSRKV